jgi:hypothetical protein
MLRGRGVSGGRGGGEGASQRLHSLTIDRIVAVTLGVGHKIAGALAPPRHGTSPEPLLRSCMA